ncbi:MAG: iron hydrogenase small subunit [Clostridia bacterium]|nr:iron hydrogenase small subunit [Clostridia bacterium]
MVTLTINNRPVSVEEHTTILEAARSVGIEIPTLCYQKGLNDVGACRVCCVEVVGTERLVAACNTEVQEGMEILTNSPKARTARRHNVELILSQHDARCAECARSGNCQLQTVANDVGARPTEYHTELPDNAWSRAFPLVRDNSKCIMCMRCLQVCDKVQDLNVWQVVGTGSHTHIDTKDNLLIRESDCALCGQCITHCPTAALRERDDTYKIYRALADPDVVTLVQIAPSPRTAWYEPFGLTEEEGSVKKLVAALKEIGFDYVFDTDWSADLTIMEEGTEFLGRLQDKENQTFPMFTSCCPGWVRFLKSQYPDMVGQLSTAKSPQGMFGAMAKSYFAETAGIDPQKIFSVSIMPCLAKKHEVEIPNLNDAGAGKDVDVSLTTREVVQMIKADNIDVKNLPEVDFDNPLGTGTGAGEIFGATGGVMEAALRTAYNLVTGENPDPDAFKNVRGLDGWKEADYEINGIPLKVAVASGLGNTRKLIEAIRAGRVQYDFVEIMACPGGCVGGGGQPIHEGQEMAGSRGQILYGLDSRNTYRFSHENPDIIACYENYLGKPNSHRAHELLHTDLFGWDMPVTDPDAYHDMTCYVDRDK